jgi:hypothetical protein
VAAKQIRLLVLSLLAGTICVPAGADEARPERKTVVPGAHYASGGLHRMLFGTRYRALWTTPIEVDVLDLRTFSGGLVPRKKGGGKQTKSLKLTGADGREWKFRSIDKDTSAVLPKELRATFAEAIAQDQISAAHPLGPLVVDALADAAGVLHANHRLVLLPDDDSLGAFRKDFGGVLGFLEQEVRVKDPVTPGFEPFKKVLDTVELWPRLERHPEEKVDAPAYLRARLFDLLIGDFDRHKDQWQWASREDGLWEPVPEDRDQSFVRYDGLVLSLVRPSQPRLVDFGPRYPNVFGLTWQGRFVDRRHLAELEWPRWEQSIAELQAAVTDTAIDAAVARLPAEYQRIDGPRLAAALKSRRQLLPRAARRFYELLADDVEVHATDAPETAHVTALPGGAIDVRVETAAATTFERRIDPRDTRLVRLYLKGGDDRVIRGPGTGAIILRAIGGAGDDVVTDAPDAGTRFYDDLGQNRLESGRGAFNGRAYTHPNDAVGNPERDWGSEHYFTPWLGAGGDLGLFLGGSVQFVRYGFRKHPYAQRHAFGVGYATGLQAFRAEYHGEVVATNSQARFQVDARASQIDLLRFYGFGNETDDPAPADDYQLEQKRFSLAPAYRLPFRRVDVTVGAVAQYTDTPRPRLDLPGLTVLPGAARPYGFGGFGQVGPRVTFALDGRDRARAASHGGLLRASASWFPKAWSVESAFGNVEGDASWFARAPGSLQPTLALRAGAKRVFGRHPFHEAAFLGGPGTLRGLRPQRYAGDSAVFGNAELRLRLGHVRLLLPSEFGVFGLADGGRVYQDGETSDRWHTGVGGGIWIAFLKPENTVSAAVARSEGQMRVYVTAGFGF